MVSIITLIDTSLVQGQLQNALGYTLKETRHLYGTYSSGMNLYNLPSSMMTALTISVIPTVSASLARNDRVHTSRVINSSLRVTGLMAFPMGLGLWALAEPIMKLCYPRYDSELGGSLLAVLGIASMFVCLMLISNSILQSYGRVHVPVFTMLIGGVVKIIFNYNLTAVPSINIHAAPFGTLVCFVIVSSLNLFFVYRTMEDKPNYFKVFAKPLIASLVMAVCARFSYRFFAAHIALGGATTTQIVNVGLAVVLAVIVYVALVLALRIVTRDDLALLPKGEKARPHPARALKTPEKSGKLRKTPCNEREYMINYPEKAVYTYDDLVDILRILRAPGGCPWDREQTHESNRRNFL